jgi:hypothetical protein
MRVLERLVPALDLALRHWMIGRTTQVLDVAGTEPFGQVACDITGDVNRITAGGGRYKKEDRALLPPMPPGHRDYRGNEYDYTASENPAYQVRRHPARFIRQRLRLPVASQSREQQLHPILLAWHQNASHFSAAFDFDFAIYDGAGNTPGRAYY